MEYIEINGERVAIPRDVVSDSREAVQQWCDAEAARRSQQPAPSSATE